MSFLFLDCQIWYSVLWDSKCDWVGQYGEGLIDICVSADLVHLCALTCKEEIRDDLNLSWRKQFYNDVNDSRTTYGHIATYSSTEAARASSGWCLHLSGRRNTMAVGTGFGNVIFSKRLFVKDHNPPDEAELPALRHLECFLAFWWGGDSNARSIHSETFLTLQSVCSWFKKKNPL